MLFALMLVPAIVMGIIVHLERGVVLYRPDHLIAHVGTEDFCRELVVVLRSQSVADIVEEGADHPVDVGVLPVGAGGGLQAMGETGNLVSGQCLFFLQAQLTQNALGGAPDVLVLERLEEEVFLGGAVLHRGEFDCLHVRRSLEKMYSPEPMISAAPAQVHRSGQSAQITKPKIVAQRREE